MRARMRRGVAAVLTASALSLTAAACGGSDSGSDGDKKAKDSAAKPLTAAQMKAGLVGVKDLPAGYKVGEETADDEKYTADKKECQPLADFLSQKIAGGTDGGSADFESADQSSMVSQNIVTFPGAGATDYAKKLSTALDACKGFGVGEGDQKMAMTIEKLSATPKAGEESHSFRMKTEIKSLSLKFETNFQVVRQGTGISRVLHVPADASGHKDFDELAKRVGEKFVKAVQS
ncbi:hypothetical protein GCM10010387_21530 [Streptomyces inusitatus]|uniref:Lipoprotein n=1 Tax=Streptomyces inusitatus TaxID=68221 RepID=A0A918Q045_9ACTN|nr:hypothetical protein [Streptomyces inusitatus]GGZ27787.1 hypothetical protein GCM10010387_21530 [Streptomyces inusitatus]